MKLHSELVKIKNSDGTLQENALGKGLSSLSGAQIDALEDFHLAQIIRLREVKHEQANYLKRLGQLNASMPVVSAHSSGGAP